MKTNRYYPVTMGVNISEIKAKTKRKNAYIKIDVPEDFAEDILKQLALHENEPFKNLQLTWVDTRIKDV